MPLICFNDDDFSAAAREKEIVRPIVHPSVVPLPFCRDISRKDPERNEKNRAARVGVESAMPVSLAGYGEIKVAPGLRAATGRQGEERGKITSNVRV